MLLLRPKVSFSDQFQIHENPELGYEEFKAHDNIVSLIRSLGFSVTEHAYGVSTSFCAEYGSGGRVVAFNAEYDALPGIGHACGHNLIATASIAAFLGLASAMKQDKVPGRVRLIGTPAEEGGGGKLKLIDAGAYDDVDACLMIHPLPGDKKTGAGGQAYWTCLANHKFSVIYQGKSAHAAMAPWQGINALDAVVQAYNGISALRQQIKPYERIHGVISDGGKRPNVIPSSGRLEYYIRSATLKEADELKARALKCFEGAAIATGCTVEYEL
jgi:amidohydrolase